MSPAALRAMPEEALAEVVRPSGYFNAKARKLKAMADFLGRYGDSIEPWRTMQPKTLRAELLAVHGIGPETADDIVLYVAGLPSFVMDVYTQRIVDRMLPRHRLRGYDAYQALFERHLPHDAPLFNEYHALLDAHAKDVCTKREPRDARPVSSPTSARRAGVPLSERVSLCVYSWGPQVLRAQPGIPVFQVGHFGTFRDIALLSRRTSFSSGLIWSHSVSQRAQAASDRSRGW